MPNSLKTKLSKLRYQGKITDEEYKELIDKLEGHDEAITAQIKWERDIAIEQLKRLGYGLGEKVEPWDCVSRNKVAEILKNNESYFDEVWYCIDLINKVDDLPSVTPSYNSIKTELKPCEDCVSRESLLILLEADTQDTNPDHFNLEDKESYGEWMLNNGFNTALVQARIYTNKLPSVKPQRPPGKWLDKKMTIKGAHGMAYGRYACSVCKKKFPNKSNYCPNCGAEMEGVSE